MAHFDDYKEAKAFVYQSVKKEHSVQYFDWGATVTITEGQKPVIIGGLRNGEK